MILWAQKLVLICLRGKFKKDINQNKNPRGESIETHGKSSRKIPLHQAKLIVKIFKVCTFCYYAICSRLLSGRYLKTTHQEYASVYLKTTHQEYASVCLKTTHQEYASVLNPIQTWRRRYQKNFLFDNFFLS